MFAGFRVRIGAFWGFEGLGFLEASGLTGCGRGVHALSHPSLFRLGFKLHVAFVAGCFGVFWGLLLFENFLPKP